MIKAVILDVDNTLLDFNASAKEAIKAAFSELKLEFNDDVLTTFLRVNDGLWAKIERKEMTREELHRVRFEIIFDKLRVNADGARMEKLFLNNLENYAIPIDGAIEAVKYLSQKYTLYTASNAPFAQQVKRLTLSGIIPYITKILNFEAQGINKPQKVFFEKCLAETGLKSDEVALIGDSISADMAGGKSAGFYTVWFNADKKEAPAGLCDAEITSLLYIKNIL